MSFGVSRPWYVPTARCTPRRVTSCLGDSSGVVFLSPVLRTREKRGGFLSPRLNHWTLRSTNLWETTRSPPVPTPFPSPCRGTDPRHPFTSLFTRTLLTGFLVPTSTPEPLGEGPRRLVCV